MQFCEFCDSDVRLIDQDEECYATAPLCESCQDGMLERIEQKVMTTEENTLKRLKTSDPILTKYKLGDWVLHHKTDHVYLIVQLPNSYAKLEDCNEPYYKYIMRDDDTLWLRAKSLMEQEERFSPCSADYGL